MSTISTLSGGYPIKEARIPGPRYHDSTEGVRQPANTVAAATGRDLSRSLAAVNHMQMTASDEDEGPRTCLGHIVYAISQGWHYFNNDFGQYHW
jgi:hypothetical protein